jgi:uncharacterized membrane protein YraQ (UPF0718 family)
VIEIIASMLMSGWMSLLDYLAAHVLLCLVPAFIIAGYMSAMIPQEVITRYLGHKAPKWISYPASAVGGFVLAVCSCTILPLFAGIWKRGAGLGAAVTFLFVGPAVNILAIAYTGAAIGMDVAIARIILSVLFGILIGLIMSWLFRAEERERFAVLDQENLFAGRADVPLAIWIVFALLFMMLIVGTLQVDWLSEPLLELKVPLDIPQAWQARLSQVGLAPQGAVLIMLLVLLAPVAYLGLEDVLVGYNRWTGFALLLTGLTILVAAPTVSNGGLNVGLTGRFFGELLLLVLIATVSASAFDRQSRTDWIWETWRFVKQIFPLLIVGVFSAGMVKAVLPEAWVQSLAGRNTLWANFIGVVFGVFMYFPTLVEVPIARMFLDLGMHRGPLLAYLIADPALSIQSVLVTGRIMGRKKTAVYVVLVSIFATIAGYLFGLLLTLR